MKITLKIDKNGVGTDKHGEKWVLISKLRSLEDYCALQISLKHGHIENVIEILKESNGMDDLKENLIRLLEAHGYQI